MKRLAAMLAVLALGLSMPALAAAQLGPTNVPAPLTTPDESQTPRTNVDEDTGLSTLQLVLIFGCAAAVIAIIAFVIVRDARGAAPSGRGGSSSAGAAGGSKAKGSGKSAREREREQAAKRKKAKAARDQRKHNRPR